jgi:hypothetical protein
MSAHSKYWRRIWLVYVVASVVVVSLDFAYLSWREHSLEPLAVPVDLSKPGRYTFTASGFHTSRYHPSFSLQIPFKTDLSSWFPSEDYRELWGGSPPTVEIEVRDGKGEIVLNDRSALTRAEGWNVTGTPGVSTIEIYKFAQFNGRMFGSYQIGLSVLRGSSPAASYQSVFQVAAIKAYALLGATLIFLALLAVVLLSGLALAVGHFVSYRQRQPNSA